MYRKNTAGQSLGFRLVNKTSGDPLTGATVAAYRTIDAGAQAAATGTVAEKGNGQYLFLPSADDLNGNQISFLFVAAGAVIEEKTVVTTAANPTDGAAFGLARIDATVSSRSTYAGETVAGIVGVTFPSDVASQTTAPAWYAAPDNATLVGLLNVGKTAFTSAALVNAPSQSHAWTANAATVLSPAPTANGFRIDKTTILGRVSVPGVCVLDSPGLNGYLARVASYDGATGDVTLSAPLPTAPRTDEPFTVEFQSDVLGLPAKLASDGLDSITIEAGLNLRQAVALIAAAELGKVSGAEANNPVFRGAGVATTRIAATCDASGNRTVVTLTPPA